MAKKPSPAELKKQGEELKKTFGAMRKVQHQFALQIGKEGIVFVADKKKPAAALWRAAKKDGGSSKGAMGTVTMKGKVMELDCEDPGAVPAGLARKAKVYFADRGQPAKVVILGVEEEGDDEDVTADEGTTEEAAAPAESGGGEAADGGGAAEEETVEEAEAGGGAKEETPKEILQREYAELVPQVEASELSPNAGIAKKIGGLKGMFEKEIEGNEKKARAVLEMLKTTITKALDDGDIPEAGAKGADPAKEERMSKIAELERSVDELLAEFA